MNILVVGNSVPLRIRSSTNYTQALPYWKIIQKKTGAQVSVIARGAWTSNDVLHRTDQIIAAFPDVCILNIGIVDCCSRPVGKNLYNWLSKKTKPSLFRLVIKALESRFRKTLVSLRGKRSWISPTQFEHNINTLLAEVGKDTNCKFILIGINNCDQRIENQLPGTKSQITEFNKALDKIGRNHVFIDPNKHITQAHTPDGIHYSVTGHDIVAQAIISAIRTWE